MNLCAVLLYYVHVYMYYVCYYVTGSHSAVKLAAPVGNASPPVLWGSRRKPGQ